MTSPSERPPALLRMIRIDEVHLMTGLSVRNIYAQIGAGTFPQALKLGTRAVRWRSDEIEAWIHARPRASVREVKKGAA